MMSHESHDNNDLTSMSNNKDKYINSTTTTPVTATQQQFEMTSIESSVSKLLTTTKSLLESLTAWSLGNVRDTQVYQEYNALKHNFASATRAFESALLPMDDMLHLPGDLFSCLADTLSKEPSSTTLQEHLPFIRDIILKLLQGLKQKQSMLREKSDSLLFSDTTPKSLNKNSSKNSASDELHPAPLSLLPLPSPSTLSEPRSRYIMPNSPTSPTTVATVANTGDTSSEEIDINDPSTQEAIDTLKHQGNLAQTSSVRTGSRTHQHLVTLPSLPHLKEQVIYLKRGDRVKRVMIGNCPDMSEVRRLFQISFSMGKEEFIINILDPKSNIEYELEDVKEIEPYSMLSIKGVENVAAATCDNHSLDEVTMNELQELFNNFVNQFLAVKKQQSVTEPAKTTTATTVLPSPDKAQQKELDLLRHDLTVLTKIYADFKSDTDVLIQELLEKSRQSQPSTMVMLDTEAREEMTRTQAQTKKAASLITTRLEVLQDTIDQLKSDVTLRKCRPSQTHLVHCINEASKLSLDMESLQTRVDDFKPSWKKTWQVQLQHIVQAQQFLKEQEALLLELKEDHAVVMQVLGQLETISVIHQERKKQQEQLGKNYAVVPVDEGFEGMTSVMRQVSTIRVDHEQRVKAVQQAEMRRSKQLSQRIDAFERELTDFVGFDKLKKTGGAEQVERQRQEKDKALIKRIFTTAQHGVVAHNLDVENGKNVTPEEGTQSAVEHPL